MDIFCICGDNLWALYLRRVGYATHDTYKIESHPVLRESRTQTIQTENIFVCFKSEKFLCVVFTYFFTMWNVISCRCLGSMGSNFHWWDVIAICIVHLRNTYSAWIYNKKVLKTTTYVNVFKQKHLKIEKFKLLLK